MSIRSSGVIEAVFVQPTPNTDDDVVIAPALEAEPSGTTEVLTLDELKDLTDNEYWSYLYAQCGPDASDDAWEVLAHTDVVVRSNRLLKRGIWQVMQSKQAHRKRMGSYEYRAWCRERASIWDNMHARRDWLAEQMRDATGLLSRRETNAIRAEQEALAAELHASRRLQEKLVAAIYFHRRESQEAGRSPIDVDLKLWRALDRRPLGLGGKSLDELWGVGRHEMSADAASIVSEDGESA